MTNSRFYSSVATATTLTGAADGSTTTITVATTAGFPASVPFTLALDYGAANEELVDVTNVAGLTLTVTRAVDGTSASSHNVGAVVRHVSSARDFTDSRTHEASSAAVHGLTGTVVGTTDTQTLTNKTLTNPSINAAALSGTFSGAHNYIGAATFNAAANLSNGGALAGTFTGTPTFSGAVVFSGGPNISNGGTLGGTFAGNHLISGLAVHTGMIVSNQSAAANPSYGTNVGVETFDRFRINADGGMEWGPGSAGRDTTLYRSAANTLKTDDALIVTGALTASAGATVTTGGLTVSAGGAAITGTVTDTATGIAYKPVQSGTQTVTFNAASTTATVTFSPAFASVPVVTCSRQNMPANSGTIMVNASAITTTGFTMNFNDGGGTVRNVTSLTGGWIAVAP